MAKTHYLQPGENVAVCGRGTAQIRHSYGMTSSVIDEVTCGHCQRIAANGEAPVTRHARAYCTREVEIDGVWVELYMTFCGQEVEGECTTEASSLLADARGMRHSHFVQDGNCETCSEKLQSLLPQ